MRTLAYGRLLINTSLTAAPVDRRDDIHRLDPRLSGRLPPGWQQRYDEWLTGPIQRYGNHALRPV